MHNRTVWIDYEPKAGKTAQLIEGAADETEGRGCEFVTFPTTGTATAIPACRRNTREAHASSEEV